MSLPHAASTEFHIVALTTAARPALVQFDVAATDIAKGLAKNAENFAMGKKQPITPRYHIEKPTQGVPRHKSSTRSGATAL